MFAGLIILLKALFYLGCLFAIGVGFHVSLKLIDGRAWLRWASLILAVSLLIRLFALNLEMVGSIKSAIDFSMFSWLWPGVKNQVVAMFIGGIALWIASLRHGRLWALAGASLIAAGFGLSGHTQSLEGAVWAPFAVAFHVAVAGFWIMAPISLWPRAQDDTKTLGFRLQRFSSVAKWNVPVMVIIGLWLSIAIAGSIDAVFETIYGRLLLLKLLAATLAIGLGAYNKTVVTARIESGELGIAKAFRGILLIDIMLFSAAITAVASATTVFGPH